MSVLGKASELIDCLGQAGEPVSLAYVRSALDMPKSSTHRLLGELAGLGIVRRTEDGRYSLGPRLLYWGEAAAETFDLRAVAEPSMRQLRDLVGESVHLYVRERDTRTCIAAVEARHELRPFIQLGRPLPLRAGAAGKLLLAFADDDVQRLEVRRARSDAASFPNAPGARLSDQLEQIRTERWATSVGERENGVAAAATPIVDSRARVVAALCISGPTTRLTPDRLAAMRKPLEASAAEISGLLRRG
ncbi:MAG: IclR family transcriptional regulator [Chloroflexota bacterium]